MIQFLCGVVRMRILVIGKNGYISRCFQKYMKKYPDIDVVAISVRDESWKDFSFEGFDAIFNTTGLAHDNARKGSREQFMYLNSILPSELAKKAKNENVKIFINMSSLIIYGEMSELGSEEFINSKTIPNPEGVYGESKLTGETILNKLADKDFKIAIIRSPLVYNENAIDNFLKLKKYALTIPLFPYIENRRSMIYSDNLCELVKLIAENKEGGFYYPQQEVHICTSKLVKDLANAARKNMCLTRLFNPLIFLLSKKLLMMRKVFGSLAVDLNESNHFDNRYRIVDYKESIKRLIGNLEK